MSNFKYIEIEKYRDQIEAIKIMVEGLPATCKKPVNEVLSVKEKEKSARKGVP